MKDIRIAAVIFNSPVGQTQQNLERMIPWVQRANAKGADLIIVGSHGRHGLALLLGSTANGVLHGATCDVLAVRVGDHEHGADES